MVHAIRTGNAFSKMMYEAVPENKVWKIALTVVPVIGAFVETIHKTSLSSKLKTPDLRQRQIERIDTLKRYLVASIARNVLVIAVTCSLVVLGILAHPVVIGACVGLSVHAAVQNATALINANKERVRLVGAIP